MTKKLNKMQKTIINSEDSSILVEAVPGSGKTFLIKTKVEALLKSGVSPLSILVLTFTRNACEELRDRINGGSKLNIFTFHSFSASIIKQDIGDFNVIEDSVKQAVILKLGKDYKPKRTLVDSINNTLENPSNLTNESDAFKQIVKGYKAYLKEEDVYDFPRCITKVASQLKTNRELRRKLKRKYKYIFIDEIQDTTEARIKLIKRLVGKNTKLLFMVGDFDQAIYGFAGVNSSVLQRQLKELNCTTFNLEHSYRFGSSICDAASNLISNNKNRTQKKIIPLSKEDTKINVCGYKNINGEANDVKNKIMHLLKKGVDPKEIAILARENSLLKRVSFVLSSTNINITTIHKSKGCEYDYIFLLGCEQNILPKKDNPIDEERRIMFVGVTRARKMLTLTYLKKGARVSSSKCFITRLSRFIKEMGIK